MYKKIIFAILLCFAGKAYAQPSQYTPMTANGYQMKRVKVDSTLHIPSFCGVPTLSGSTSIMGAIAFDTCNNILYKYNHADGWTEVGGGETIDTTSLSNRINGKIDSLKKSNDSVFAYKNGTAYFQFKDSSGGGGSTSTLLALPFTTDHISANNNQYVVGDVVWYLGNVYRCLANNDAILPTSTIYWSNLGSGYPLVQQPADWSSTSGNNQILNKPTILTPSDTVSLSNRINDKIDSLERRADSIYAFKNGQWNFQYKTLSTNTGGGASVNYYLNGSISQGTFGGNTYYQLSKTPIAGAGTNFTRTNAQGNGYIASFITDAGDPNLLNIPGGNWNLEFYFNSSSSGGSPSFYAEIYKVSATNVFTLIASGSTNAEGITNGTVVDQYYTSVPMPQTTLVATDRIALRIFVTTGGRNITLHTEDNNLSEVLTTFSTGLNALNGLTTQVQYFQTGASGTDFNISSASDMHTFNIPNASTVGVTRGLVSNAELTAKLNASDTTIFQRKQLPAYSIAGNNTNAAANATAVYYKDTAGTYTGTITFTATTAPSGTTNHSYRWTRIGNLVTLNITLVYSVAGGTVSQVILTIPSDAPTPAKPAGLTAASNTIYPVLYQYSGNISSQPGNAAQRAIMRTNAANNGSEIVSLNTGTTITVFYYTVQYTAQ